MPAYGEIRFDNATLVDVLDANGIALRPPYPAAAAICVAIIRGDHDANAIRFADLLGNVGRILVLPAP